MKRTGFRKKSYKEIIDNKKSKSITRTKKVKTIPKSTRIKRLKNTLWEACRTFVYERDNLEGKIYCFTSDKEIEGSNRQLGHGIPSAVGGGLCRYHPFNLHYQSYYENINLGGNGGEYYRRQVLKYGQEKIDALYSLKNKTIKADEIFYQTMIDLYKEGDEGKIVEYLHSL